MTTEQQHPIGTPFTLGSTADEVLAGIDLTGKMGSDSRPPAR